MLFEGIIYLGYFFFVMKNKITFWYGIYCGTLSLRKVTVLPPMDGKYGSGPGFARFWRIGDPFLALAGTRSWHPCTWVTLSVGDKEGYVLI